MNLERTLLLLMLVPIAGSATAVAQTAEGEAAAGAAPTAGAEEMPTTALDEAMPVVDDEELTPLEPSEPGVNDAAISILDQTVPVADEAPDLLESEDVGPGVGVAPPMDEQSRELQVAELVAAFDAFRDLKDQGILDEAENVAKRVIEMSIRLFGPTSNDTARALSNLGQIQFLTGDYEAAEQNFEAAIEIIEDNEDRLNAQLVNPLKGLGAAQLENGRPDLAARSYQRAVHITHVNEGPHNLDQVDALQALAEVNLRMGDLESAKNNQDMIYALNLRYYSNDAMSMVPSLMRRAQWQRRTGYHLDERATYRRIIRIIETTQGKDDIQLVPPLLELGESYFYIDVTDTQAQFQTTTAASGEMYFKRAVRIAEEHPNTDWRLQAQTKLAFGDYYNFRGDNGRARRNYRAAWGILSADDPDIRDVRRRELERPVLLRQDALPRYVGSAKSSDRATSDPDLRSGRIVASYAISSRGRVASLKIVEATPEEFEDVRRIVQRELRSRIYRPKFVEAEPMGSDEQLFTHEFFYMEPDLEQLKAQAELDRR
ncbi:MAG: tetratricopeptide repeat protein [Pseudomonadota bacterium]